MMVLHLCVVISISFIFLFCVRVWYSYRLFKITVLASDFISKSLKYVPLYNTEFVLLLMPWCLKFQKTNVTVCPDDELPS